MKGRRSKFLEVVFVFFKLGLIGFGGPAAHIALMESEIVENRKWLSKAQFLDLIGITNLIPGPNSTEMTMHCGYERAGWVGLLLAGMSFILPSVLLTGSIAWFYSEYGNLPEVSPFLSGIKPVILAIIFSAIIKLGKKALKSIELGVLGALVLISSLIGVSEIYALLSAGIIGMIYFTFKNREGSSGNRNWILFPAVPVAISHGLGSWKIFFIFLKVGAVLYGSGYVLFAYLDAELVQKGLLSNAQLMDAIAVGQITPGPVLSTATFVGYQLGGWSSAMMATAGIFLPSFIFVFLTRPLLKHLKSSKVLRYFLDAVNVSAVAVMVAVLFKMGHQTLIDWRSILLCLIALGMVFSLKKLNAVYVVLFGAIAGFLLHQI